jgi:hypothetical protein
LILGPSFVMSFQERAGDIFDPIRERIRNGKGRIRRMGADYLARSCIASCNRWKVYDHTQDYLSLPGVVKSGFVASETKTMYLD